MTDDETTLAKTIQNRVPKRLDHLKPYILEEVLSLVDDRSDKAALELITDSVILSVSCRIRGYGQLGGHAQNRSSLPALAFG